MNTGTILIKLQVQRATGRQTYVTKKYTLTFSLASTSTFSTPSMIGYIWKTPGDEVPSKSSFGACYVEMPQHRNVQTDPPDHSRS